MTPLSGTSESAVGRIHLLRRKARLEQNRWFPDRPDIGLDGSYASEKVHKRNLCEKTRYSLLRMSDTSTIRCQRASSHQTQPE